MAHEATPLLIQDLSSFARQLAREWTLRHQSGTEPPGHVALQNLIARAAGFATCRR